MSDLPIIEVLGGLDSDGPGGTAEDDLQNPQTSGGVVLESEGHLLHLLLDGHAFGHPAPPDVPARGVRGAGVAVEGDVGDVVLPALEAPVGDEPPPLEHGRLVVDGEDVAVLVARTGPAVPGVQEFVEVFQRVDLVPVLDL